jgi:type II secretory pathway pseudopilin PulG
VSPIFLAAASEGLSETFILDIAVSVLGLLMVPLWLQGRETRRRTEAAKERAHGLELAAAEARGKASSDSDKLIQTVVSFHGRLDGVEDKLEVLTRALIAKGTVPHDITLPGRARSPSRVPRDPNDG